jgi:cyanophycinase
VGGAEFTPGNEAQDELVVRSAPSGDALVLPTAAGRQGRRAAIANAQRWFARLGLAIEELPVLTRTDASDPVLIERARAAGVLYLVGGAPGLVVEVLRATPVWAAMLEAWRRGAALAGSSAGAMALCDWVLLRSTWPERTARRHAPGLGLLPDCAVVPHLDTFGRNWSWAWDGDGPVPVMLGIDERTAAVWERGAWRAEGPGRVTVLAGESRESATAGQRLAAVPQPRVTGRPAQDPPAHRRAAEAPTAARRARRLPDTPP